jgi:hypothetical protein
MSPQLFSLKTPAGVKKTNQRIIGPHRKSIRGIISVETLLQSRSLNIPVNASARARVVGNCGQDLCGFA